LAKFKDGDILLVDYSGERRLIKVEVVGSDYEVWTILSDYEDEERTPVVDWSIRVLDIDGIRANKFPRKVIPYVFEWQGKRGGFRKGFLPIH
jgi:hypothetical protein